MRLARILDDPDAARVGQREDRVHVGGLSVEMDGDDRPHAGRQRRLDRPGRDRVRARLDVHQDGTGARHRDRESSKGARARARHDLVAGPDAVGEERELKGPRAVADADGVGDPAVARELRFERLDLGAEDVVLAAEDPPHRLVDLAPERAVLCCRVEHRHAIGARAHQ